MLPRGVTLTALDIAGNVGHHPMQDVPGGEIRGTSGVRVDGQKSVEIILLDGVALDHDVRRCLRLIPVVQLAQLQFPDRAIGSVVHLDLGARSSKGVQVWRNHRLEVVHSLARVLHRLNLVHHARAQKQQQQQLR